MLGNQHLKSRDAVQTTRNVLQIKMRGSAHETSYLSAGKVTVFAQFTVQCFEEHFIGDLADVHAGVIQDCNDAFVLLLHKVHNDLVVEVIDLQDTAQKRAAPTGARDPGPQNTKASLCIRSSRKATLTYKAGTNP